MVVSGQKPRAPRVETSPFIDFLVLTDENGDALTEANTLGKNRGSFKQSLLDGVPAYFTIDYDGDLKCQALTIDVKLKSDSTATMAIELEKFWDDDGWSGSSASYAYDLDNAGAVNGVTFYPLIEAFFNQPIRLKVTLTGDDGVVYSKVVVS